MRDINAKLIKFMNLIKFIHENKELPKRQKDKDLFMFYTTLQQSAKKSKDKQREGKKLNETETINLHYYNLVEEALSKYTLTKEQKLQLLIEFIRKNHRLPKVVTNGIGESEEFSDGTSMRDFFKHFKASTEEIKKKQNLKKELTKEELMYLKYDQLIKEELAKYKMTKQEKVEELIKFIYENQRLPRPKKFNKGKTEVLFRDKTDMSDFYRALKTKGNDILKNRRSNETLTIKDEETIDFYNRVQEALYSVKMKKEEKENQLIAFIHKNHRLPKLGEAQFQNGKDMRNYYTYLERDAKDSMKKFNNNHQLTAKKQQNLECYNKVKKALSLHKMGPEEIAKTSLSEIDLIIDYLELLRDKNSCEEMRLLCETIIKYKDLTEEEEKKLRSIFQKYIKCAYQQLEEKAENKMHDAMIKIK